MLRFHKRQTGRWFRAICFLFLLAGLSMSENLSVTAHTIGSPTGEIIERFHAKLTVHKDARLSVTETIDYDFGHNERHGIYRDIPVKYQTASGNHQSIVLKVKGVTDEQGREEKYETSTEGNNLRIKIGDPDKTITGPHTYVIEYETAFIYGYFDAYDEIYWNVTGNAWESPIKKTAVEIVLPEPVPTNDLEASCYMGSFGSTETCDLYGGTRDDGYAMNFPERLEPGEGVTVALGFPKGLIREPHPAERALLFVFDNPLVLLPIATLIVMYLWWYRHGRDPKGRGTIIPEYEAPEKLSALEVAGILENKVSSEHISAGLIELAVSGLITIRQTEKKKLLVFTEEDYVFRRTAKPAQTDIERALLLGLFDSIEAPEKEVALSELKQKFYTHIPKIEKEVFSELVKKKYFLKSPKAVREKYVLYGIIAVVASVFLLSFLSPGPANFVGLAISFVIYFFFVIFMPSVTKAGALMKERILGLKDYLQIAEKNRLEFHNAPAKRPELFEALLPFAFVLGVEKAWAKEFEDLYQRPPEWYSSTAGGSFSANSFVSDLGGFQSAASGTLASAPGGSSGSGGGGSSGGGGGGGGGGSW